MIARWQRERITLVIEAEAVRLMAVLNGRVTRWGSAPLPRGTLDEGGGVAAPAVLSEVLERLWAAQGAVKPGMSGMVALAIPGSSAATALTSLASMERVNTPLLQDAARAALPLPDSYLAWQEVGAPTQRNLFVVAAPTMLVDGYVSALARAGLGTSIVDVKPLALIRGVGLRHAVIVDGERTQGTVIVVDDVLPRRVRFQGLAFPMTMTLEDKVMRLGELLYETLREYNSHAGEHVLHPGVPIYLTGFLAEHPLLQELVREVLGHPVGHATPPFQLPPDMPLSQFVANVGLALKQGWD